jgi:hypothetical protein
LYRKKVDVKAAAIRPTYVSHVLHFVYQADDDLYIPRSILIDLEPRVIQGILDGPQKSLYNRENIYMGTNGAGAGNLWSAGYFRETKEMDKILDMINREADNSDSLEVKRTKATPRMQGFPLSMPTNIGPK